VSETFLCFQTDLFFSTDFNKVLQHNILPKCDRRQLSCSMWKDNGFTAEKADLLK